MISELGPATLPERLDKAVALFEEVFVDHRSSTDRRLQMIARGCKTQLAALDKLKPEFQDAPVDEFGLPLPGHKLPV